MKTGAAKGELEGELVVSFLSEEIKLSAAAVEANELQTLLGSMRNIDSVDVSRGEVRSCKDSHIELFVHYPPTHYISLSLSLTNRFAHRCARRTGRSELGDNLHHHVCQVANESVREQPV